mgnify:CR=1 FL=1
MLNKTEVVVLQWDGFCLYSVKLPERMTREGEMDKYQLLANKWKHQADKSDVEQEQAWLYACAADLESLISNDVKGETD